MGEIKYSLALVLLSLIPTCLPHGPVQYQKQTDYGTYKYGYDTGGQGAHSFKQEHRGFDGIVHGRYGYTDTDGKLRYVEYSAGPFGFRVKGDNEPSYYTADGLPRSEYKVPTDTELTDLDAGLAKIKKDQLFGVPVQPYVKGYVGSPPPSEGRVDAVQPVPVPPPVVQVPLKGHVDVVVPPAPVKTIFRVDPPLPPPPIVQQVIDHPVKGYVPPPPAPPRVVVRVKPDHGRPYIKGELPPHRRKVVVKTKGRVPVQPVVPIQPVIPVDAYIPPPPPQPIVHDGYVKGYVPQPPPAVVREVIHQQPLPVKTYVPPPVVPVKTYVPPPVVPVKTYVPPPPPVRAVVHDGYVKGYVPQPPPVIVREEVYPQPVPVKTYVPPPIVPVKTYVPPPVVPVKTYVPPRVVPVKTYVPPPPPPKAVVHDGYVKGYVPQPPPEIVRQVIHPQPLPVKGYVPPPVIARVPPKTILREEIFPAPKGYVPPPPPKVIVREQIYERPVPAYTKGYVPPPPPQVVVREQVYEKPVPIYTKGYVPAPLPPKTIVRQQIFEKPVQVYTKGYVPPPKTVVREHIFERPVVVPPKTIVREEVYPRPVPAKGYYVPPKVIVREEVVPVSRSVQHPKGFVPVPKARPQYVKEYIPPPRVVPAKPQSLYIKGFVTTPRPFAAPVRQPYVPISSKQLFDVPAPKYSKGYVPEIRRQTEKGSIVTVQRPVSSHTGRKVPPRGDTGEGLRWVAAPEDRYRPEYRGSYAPPPSYAYAPY